MNERRTCTRAVAPATPTHDTVVVTTTSLLSSILNWLRAGYPEGVPGPDRVPLLALLRCTPLTEDQIKEVVRNISDGAPADQPLDHDEIEVIAPDYVNEAYERVLASDVRYRFVIDTASLSG